MEITQEPIKTGGLRLSGLDNNDPPLPSVQRCLWKRGEEGIDSARDDSEGVVAVLNLRTVWHSPHGDIRASNKLVRGNEQASPIQG